MKCVKSPAIECTMHASFTCPRRALKSASQSKRSMVSTKECTKREASSYTHRQHDSRCALSHRTYVLPVRPLADAEEPISQNRQRNQDRNHAYTFHQRLQSPGCIHLSSHVCSLFWSGYHHEPLQHLADMIASLFCIAGTAAALILCSVFLVCFCFCVGIESVRQRDGNPSLHAVKAGLTLPRAARLPSRV